MKFKKIYIEITNVCNLSCSFCPKIDRAPEFMSIETFEDILKKIQGFTNYIYLHVKGEPLLHPQIFEFINLAEKYNLKVNITSNGTILNEEILNSKGLRQFNFSLHSFEDDSEVEKSDYIKNILKYSIKAQEKGKIVSLRLWNLKEDNLIDKNSEVLKEIEDFYELTLEPKKFVRGQGVKLRDRIYLNFEEEFVWPSLESNHYEEKGFCHGLSTHMGILVDGTVIPCCLDDNGVINLGNIKNSSLEDILGSQRVMEMIKGFKNRVCTEELCKKCEFKTRF